MATLTQLPAVLTPRLILREITLSDSQDFSAYMMQPEYHRFIAMRLRSEPEVAAFVARCVSRQRDGRRNIFHLAAEEQGSGEVIGDGFLICQSDRSIEIGWGLHPAMWRLGLGAELGEALLAHAFERLKAKRTWCKVMGGNRASKALARRLGMRHEKMIVAPPPEQAPAMKSVDTYVMTADQYFERPY